VRFSDSEGHKSSSSSSSNSSSGSNGDFKGVSAATNTCSDLLVNTHSQYDKMFM
jgi:hypothetical protein